MPLRLLKLVSDRRAGSEIDEAIGWIRWRLDQDHADAPPGGGSPGRFAHLRDIDTIGETKGRDAEGTHLVFQQGLSAAIERPTVDDGVARPQEGEAGGRDRGHTAGKDGAALSPVPDRQAILQDF